MDCPGLLENFRAEGDERYCVAVLHGDPVQLHSLYCPVTAAQVRESGLQYLALGHIHKYGAFRGGSTVCGWPGSPMGRGFDETGERGVYVTRLKDGHDVRFVPLGSIGSYVLNCPVSESLLQHLLFFCEMYIHVGFPPV
jgi:DNA repair exonuclease SbcCD nuclease subunit